MTDTNKVHPEPSDKLSYIHHPHIILIIAVLLPGVGQVLNNTPGRGMLMICFMIMLGMVTFYTTTPEHSFLGRFAGGLFIYALSIMDAYRWARYRWEYFKSRDKKTV